MKEEKDKNLMKPRATRRARSVQGPMGGTKVANSISSQLRVLKRNPLAFSWSRDDCWVIYVPTVLGNQTIGRGKTAALAWKDAAKRYRRP